MLLFLIIALALGGVGLALAARAAVMPRIRAEERLARVAAYGYGGGAPGQTTPDRTALLPKLAARVGSALLEAAPGKGEVELRKLLLAAGAWNTTPATVLGYRALAAGLLGGLAVWTGLSGDWSPFALVLCAGYVGVMGWIAPMFALKSRARRRTEQVELELPELVDLLVVTLEAGVGFIAALQRSAERMTGPLADEIRLTLREHQLGLGLDAALGNLLERCDIPGVRAFVRAVVQSEALGTSIGQVMRDLAADMRLRRRQIIEEKAQKAPIKILFPLAFLILPALLIVVLYPGFSNIAQTLGGS
jgi:tight adherence protein C